MQALEALIFDVDGTLADTERDGHRLAFNRAFQEAGLDWEWTLSLYGELLKVTGGKERILHFMRQWRPEALERPGLEAFVRGLHQRKTAQYLALLGTGAIPLRPGVMRLLAEARAAGLRLAIATTTTPENVIRLLECAGSPTLPTWFEVIAAGDLVSAKKPAPDIFHYALSQLRLPAEACVAIEDSANGVQAALGAGLKALVVTPSTYTRGEDFSGAALVVDSLEAILGDGPDGPAGESRDPAKADEGRGPIDLARLRALHRRSYG